MNTPIKLSKSDKKIVQYFAREHKISFQKALLVILNMGVVHLQKKDINLVPVQKTVLNMGVVHPRRITRTITIIETVEVA